MALFLLDLFDLSSWLITNGTSGYFLHVTVWYLHPNPSSRTFTPSSWSWEPHMLHHCCFLFHGCLCLTHLFPSIFPTWVLIFLHLIYSPTSSFSQGCFIFIFFPLYPTRELSSSFIGTELCFFLYNWHLTQDLELSRCPEMN